MNLHFVGFESFLGLRKLVCLALSIISISFVSQTAFATTYYSKANGSWNSASTWSTVGLGNSTNNGTFPVAGDDVVIGNGYSISVTANAFCATLTMTNTSPSNTVSIGSGVSLTVSGLVTISRSATPPGNTVNTIDVAAGTLNAGSIAFTNDGSQARHLITISTGTVNVTGDITTNASGSSATIAFSGAGFLNIGGALFNTGGGTINEATTSTINYNGGVQTLFQKNYTGNVTLSGTGVKNLQSVTSIGGNLTLSGTASTSANVALSIGGKLIIGDGCTFSTLNSLTVSGTTEIGSGTSGTILIANQTGTKTFGQKVTVNSGGTWNNSSDEDIHFQGGLSNLGTFIAGNGSQNFESSSQTIDGILTIPTIDVKTGITLTNNGTLNSTVALSGAGGFAQGAGSILNISSTSGVTTFSATASNNTVSYIGAAQTVRGVAYANLVLSGSGVKTLQTGTSTLSGSLTLGGTVSVTATNSLNIGGAVTLGSGTTFIGGPYTHTVAGNWTDNGSVFSNNGGTIILNGATQSIGGSATQINLDNLTLAGSGVKTFALPVIMSGAFSINAGVSANLGVFTSHSAKTLLLGGASQVPGTWGSTSSAATKQNNTFFSGTGYVTVIAYTFYSRSSGNWSSFSTWSITGYGGSAAGLIPSANDIVYIGTNTNGSRTVTVDVAASCTAINFDVNTSDNATLTINSGISLSVSEAITIPRPSVSNSVNNILNVGAGTLSAGSIAFTSGGNQPKHQVTISTGTLTVTGDITTDDNRASATITISGAGTINAGVGILTTATVGGTFTTVAGSTVNYNGANQTVRSMNYLGNLILSGSGVKTLQTGTTSIGGNFTLSGTASATTLATLDVGGDLNIGDGSSLTAGFTLTVSGATAVGGSSGGQLSITSTSGTSNFTGLVTIGTGGMWNNSGNSAATFNGGITNNGSFASGTGIHTFNTNSQQLNGNLVINNVTVTGASIILTNNGSLTVSTTLAGTGKFTQAVNSTLNLGGTITISTLNASNSGNTVSFNGSGAQTIFIPATVSSYPTYYNLIAGGAGTKTLPNTTIAINGDLTIYSTLNGNGAAKIVRIRGNWINYNNFTESGAGIGGTIIFDGTTNQSITRSVAGGETFYNLQVNKASGTLTLNSQVTVEGTLTMAGGNIDAGTNQVTVGISATSSGALSYTAGSVIGKYEKWITATATAYILPVGTSAYYRPATVTFSNLTTNGTVIAKFNATPPANSGLPLTESGVTLYNTFNDGYWSLTAANALASTSFDLQLSGNGFTAFPFDGNTRLLTRTSSSSPWTLNGTHAAASGSLVKRSGINPVTGEYCFGDDTNCSGPSVSTISGNTSVCINEAGDVYSVTNTDATDPNYPGFASGTSFNWSIGGGIITSGQNTSNATVTWGSTGMVGTISVVVTNSCTSSGTISQSVNINPVAPTSITGRSSVPQNPSANPSIPNQSYSVTATSGYTYFWTVTGGTIIGSNTGSSISVQWGAAGTGSVCVQSVSSCGSSANYCIPVNIYVFVASTGNSTSWSDPNTWTCSCVPAYPDNVVILSGHSVSLNVSASTNSFSISSGSLFSGSGAHPLTVQGDLIVDGTINSVGTTTISLTGSSQTIDGTGTIGNSALNINSSVSIASGATLTRNSGTTTIASGVVVTNNGSIAFSGNVTGTDATSIWKNTESSSLTVGGTLLGGSTPVGTLDATASGNTIGYSGNSAQTIISPSSAQYQNVTLTGTGTKTAPSSTLNVGGNWNNNSPLNSGGGTIVFNGTSVISGTVSPNFNNVTISNTLTGSTGTFNVAGNFVNNGTFNHNNGTIGFNGSTVVSGTSQTTFNSINFSGASLTVPSIFVVGDFTNSGTSFTQNGTITFNGSTTISQSTTTQFNEIILNGTSLTFPASEVDIAGDFTIAAGTFNHGNGTFKLNGPTNQSLNVSGATFYNLATSKSSGTSVSMLGDISIASALTLTSGNLNLNGKQLTLGGVFNSGGSSDQFLVSNSSSSLVINGTGSLGTLYFAPSGNSLSTLTLNNASAIVGLGNSLTVATALNLTAGTFNNSTFLSMSSGATLTRNSNASLGGNAPSGGPYKLVYDGTGAMTAANELLGSLSDLSTAGTFTGTVSQSAALNTTANLTINNGTWDANGNAMSLPSISIGSVSSGGTLKAPSSTLSLSGDFTLTSGVFTHNNGTVSFSGSSSHINGSNIAFYNLTTTGGTTNVEGTATLQNTLSVTAGTFDADGADSGVFTLLSTGDKPTADARVAQLGGTISGNMTVQRYLTRVGSSNYNYNAYRDISSPVQSSVAFFQNVLPVTGIFTGNTTAVIQADGSTVEPPYNGSTGVDYAAATLTTYNQATAKWEQFPIADNGEKFVAGTGYSFFQFGANQPFVSAGHVTSAFRGIVNQGAYAISLGYTAARKSSAGWNLVGNPYPSAIDWTTVSRTSQVLNAFYFDDYNTSSGVPIMQTYTAAGVGTTNTINSIIAMGQAFWVRASATGQSITFNESSKTAASTMSYRAVQPTDLVRINLFKDDAKRDITVIYFSDNATDGFDEDYDAPKFTGRYQNYIGISSVQSDSTELAINSLPYKCTSTAKLNLSNATSGAYQLVFADFESMDATMGMQLKDNYLNKVVDVRKNSIYAFMVDESDPKTFGSERFTVVFTRPSKEVASITVVDANTLESNYANGNQWYFDGKVVEGGTAQKIKATQSGTYRLEVSTNGCLISVEKEFVVVGEGNSEPGVRAYPNPVNGILTIEIDGDEKASGEAFSVTGVKIASLEFTNQNGKQVGRYDFSNVSSGVYVIKVEQAGKVKFVRVVKE